MKIVIRESTSMPRVISEYLPPWGESKEVNFITLKKWRLKAKPFVNLNMGGNPITLMRTLDRPGKEILFVTGIEQDRGIDRSYLGQELIQYSVVIEKVHLKGLLNILAASQVSVWRNDDYSLPNLATKIFLTILLPRSGWVLSDTVQSTRGRVFWEKRVIDAIETKKYHVYALGVGGLADVVEQVHEISTFKQMEDYYSLDLRGEYWRILMGNKELPKEVLGLNF